MCECEASAHKTQSSSEDTQTQMNHSRSRSRSRMSMSEQERRYTGSPGSHSLDCNCTATAVAAPVNSTPERLPQENPYSINIFALCARAYAPPRAVRFQQHQSSVMLEVSFVTPPAPFCHNGFLDAPSLSLADPRHPPPP
eukprot:scaffold20658_cov101-Isochrysis_galbana.AAC.3